MDPQEKTTLEDLFDFSRDDWLPHHQRVGKHSLSDGMEIYELLDADFPGKEGAEVTIDQMTGDILTSNIRVPYGNAMYVTISPTELFPHNFGFTSATCSA